MKYARCPNCNGRLGIPEKKRGLPVACPKCSTEFLPADKVIPAQSSTSSKKKLKLRAMPLPTSIASEDQPVNSGRETGVADSLSPPKVLTSTPKAAYPDPPVKLGSPPPVSKSKNDMLPPGTEAVSPDVSSDGAKPKKKKKKSKKDKRRAVASIVKTESIQPQLSTDGKLPTLQLNDDFEAKPPEESKTNPAILTAVICFSLLSSGLMLLLLGGEENDDLERLEKTRQSIRTFYQIRPDQELKPYQLELRQAQLAHSRGDYYGEIRAYQSVMYRFRAEDLSEFSGLTGSPTSDRELEEWVSILLNEAKQQVE